MMTYLTSYMHHLMRLWKSSLLPGLAWCVKKLKSLQLMKKIRCGLAITLANQQGNIAVLVWSAFGKEHLHLWCVNPKHDKGKKYLEYKDVRQVLVVLIIERLNYTYYENADPARCIVRLCKKYCSLWCVYHVYWKLFAPIAYICILYSPKERKKEWHFLSNAIAKKKMIVGILSFHFVTTPWPQLFGLDGKTIVWSCWNKRLQDKS